MPNNISDNIKLQIFIRHENLRMRDRKHKIKRHFIADLKLFGNLMNDSMN